MPPDCDVQSVEVRVDDDDVGDGRSSASQLGEARLAHRAAIGAGAFVAADGDRLEDRFARREVELGDVAGGRPRHPLGNPVEVGDRPRGQLAELEPTLGLVSGRRQLAEALQAHVVAAPFEHGPVEIDRQCLGEEREILAGELILQRLGRRGHDHPVARRDRRHEVGEGLAGAGTGLHDEVPPGVDRRLDEVGHALLARTLLGVGQRRRDSRQRSRRWLRQDTRAIAASSSSPSKSGQFLSVKYTGAPAACQSRKLETRPSPLVRTRTSTGGSSGRYS